MAGELLTPDDITFLNTSGAATPACVFGGVEEGGLLYRCRVTSHVQQLTWGVLGDARGACIKSTTVETRAMDLQVSLQAASTLASPLCSSDATWSASLPLALDVNPASGFEVSPDDVSVNDTACVLAAAGQRLDCHVPAGVTAVEVAVTKNGFTARNITVFNAPAVDYTLSAAARQSSIVTESGPAAEAVVDVYVGGGLTQNDVTSSYAGCVFTGSSGGVALTYRCRDLPIGDTHITFSANKSGCPVSDTVEVAVNTRMSAGPDQSVRTCDPSTTFAFNVTVARGSAAVGPLKVNLPEGLTKSNYDGPFNASAGQELIMFKGIPVGSHDIQIWADAAHDGTVSDSVVLSVTQTGVASIENADRLPPVSYVATSDDLPSQDRPVFADVYLVMRDGIASSDVRFLNTTGAARPECVFVGAQGADLLYRCRVDSGAQRLTWGVLGNERGACLTAATIQTVPLDLHVSLPATLAPATPLCKPTDKWMTQITPRLDVNAAAGVGVSLDDVSVNNTACVVNTEERRIDCAVPAGITPVMVTVTKSGFTASNVTVFNVPAGDYTLDARFGGEPRKLLPLAPPANATALPPLTLVAGADVAPGDIAHPEGCDPVGNATLPGGRTQYAYSCGADAVGFGRYARAFFAVSQGNNHHIDPNTGSSEPGLFDLSLN
ncbi:hypothetical protein MNEG_14796 [Monoraphidium neglectum]|uniref:Uncharacterized protein n=1 Tax=Monoraphidium neglectum TaxID=145388 RepID=A0A0D2IZB6_9CHLO|nr:hypothetical protein MNEG_14796 [Monoraphidium neglectum]KIY93167.1 hypothetical protein MNEG_14796 [Monoraphidium neglectum]|eukprot:XP_013892187.1 hypothetical protein MNEG_14796 [Monoraphidium neglectum]